jgi:hypothetical protein
MISSSSSDSEIRPPLLRAFAQKSRDHAPLPASAIERSIHEHDLESTATLPANAWRRRHTSRVEGFPLGK